MMGHSMKKPEQVILDYFLEDPDFPGSHALTEGIMKALDAAGYRITRRRRRAYTNVTMPASVTEPPVGKSPEPRKASA